MTAMATAAIDLGADRARLAVYDRAGRRPVVVADVPTLAYVPRSGPILVGASALGPIEADPLGAVRDLKARLGGPDLVRNRRRCRPDELIARLLAEIRTAALARPGLGDPLTDCCLAIPLEFDSRQAEALRLAATGAGFAPVSAIDAPLAALRDHDRRRPVLADHAIVCDLGRTAKLAALRRRDSSWRADRELRPPHPWEVDAIPPRLLMDALRALAGRLAGLGAADAPLLLVGGNARGPDLAEAFAREGWDGEVRQAEAPADAIVLGGVATLRACPECDLERVPLLDRTCAACGCPSCPECGAIVAHDAATCPRCGYPLADEKRAGPRP